MEAARGASPTPRPPRQCKDAPHRLGLFRTKLAAAVARCRIKHDALSIECILPETIRKQQERASALPLFAWVNTLKVSLEEVHSTLQREGFTRVESLSKFDGCTYCLDVHCEDLLIFPSAVKEQLLTLELFTHYKLLLQDKSRSLAVHSVKSLLNMDDDILIAHAGSGLTVAHIYWKYYMRKILQASNQLIISCRKKLKKVILLLPRCSSLGVSNPVEFILNEHEDADLLRDFSQGCVAEDKLNVLAEQQLKELTRAMQFSKVQAVVYCILFSLPYENEAVINKALTSGAEGAKAQPYKLCPPVLPLCCKSEINTSAENFFKLELSDISNSCFLAVLARESCISPERHGVNKQCVNGDWFM
uniref:Uncharacterized protein n=1 Tax=Sphaerodactylus townsendi TaxID=933632 RepID=A0ACB8E6F3_9SAUR